MSLVQSRQQLRSGHKIQVRAQTTPATFIVFDQLYDEYRPLLGRPLSVRRDMLSSTLASIGPASDANHAGETNHAGDTTHARDTTHAGVVFSQGMVGAWKVFFHQVVEQQLEGIVAKRLDSLYRPGRRNGAWIKIKPPAIVRSIGGV